MQQLTRFQLLCLVGRLPLLRHQVLVLGVASSVKSRLKGVGVDDVKLPEHDKTSRGLLVLVVGELAVVEAKQLVLLRQEVWQDLDQVVVLVLVDRILAADASVHEHVSLATMTMHVAE